MWKKCSQNIQINVIHKCTISCISLNKTLVTASTWEVNTNHIQQSAIIYIHVSYISYLHISLVNDKKGKESYGLKSKANPLQIKFCFSHQQSLF